MATGKENNDGEASSSTKTEPLHPTYTVTNVQNKIRTLDGTKVTYSSWVKLFKLHAKAYEVLNHIDGTSPPEETDPTYVQWSEIDALILQWIYSTVSDDILDRNIDNDISAITAWNKIQDIYLNNKQARALALEHEFTNMKLTNSAGFDEYCQKPKELTGKLADVGQPMTETRLVLQLVSSLPLELDTIGTIVNGSPTTWDSARGQIELEIQRQAARSESTRETVLLHSQNPNTTQATSNNTPLANNQQPPYQSNYKGNNYDPNYRGRGRGGQPWRGGGRNRGRGGRGNISRGPWQNSNYPS
ncbi:uncharacterized protein LOC143554523 [Bidens hawaiensis]|uniref:uncharacterized protein LOC143554523 n=1 Tax=Bidens hawaiensis TaxID=980011 RepID=UPI00404A1A72